MNSHPILNDAKNIIIYVVAWLFVSIFYFLLITFSLNISYPLALADSLVFNFLLAVIGLSFWYPARFISFDDKIYRVLINHLVSSIFSTAIWLSSGYFLINLILKDDKNYIPFFGGSIAWRFLLGILFYFVITSFYYLITYSTNLREKVIKEAELKNLITQAELKTLKFQINPHFIFNSLNSMSALTDIEPSRAKQMIIKLADFLRYTLANNDQQKNSLNEELKNIKLYLDIEKIRFEDKFEYFQEFDPECGRVEIPSMILQPIFENAIKHAVYETLDKIIIKLTCTKKENYLMISISNNFEGESNKKGAGVGLKNIKERLALIYQQENLLEVKKENGKFTVNIYIPLKTIS